MEDDETREESGQPSPSAEEWISSRQTGIDPDESFRAYFEKYYPVVHSFFERQGLSAEESHDLTQETFLHVYRSLSTFRGDARFETWLFEISANVWRNSLRKRAARKRYAEEVGFPGGDAQQLDPGELIAEEDGPLESLLDRERSELLRGALNDLPAQMRRCVVLRIDHGLKYREIAKIMRVSVDTVSAHLFQARQLLREKLADPGTTDV